MNSVHFIIQHRNSEEFDTLGTWDTRLHVQIDETASIKAGTVVPDIDLKMIGTFTNQGRRTYQAGVYIHCFLSPSGVRNENSF